MENNFQSRRVTRKYRQTIHARPETLFPLLCPVREAEWLDGWRAHMIYSVSGRIEEGAVFRTPKKGEADTIWIVTKHDAVNKEIRFARFTPDSRTCVLEISVIPKGSHQSFVDIAYTYTGIAPKGNGFIDGFSEDAFLEDVVFWEKSMNYFLQTGKRLKRHARTNAARA